MKSDSTYKVYSNRQTFSSLSDFYSLERRTLLKKQMHWMFCRMISISQTCLYLIKLSVEVYLFQGTENWKYYFGKSIVRRMIQERRLRVTHTVHTRKNSRLLKAKKGLTNSLPLRQLSILSLTQSIVFQVWASMLHIRLRPYTHLLT